MDMEMVEIMVVIQMVDTVDMAETVEAMVP